MLDRFEEFDIASTAAGAVRGRRSCCCTASQKRI